MRWKLYLIINLNFTATIANQNEVLTNLLAELNTAIKSNISQQFQKPKYLDLFPFQNEEDIIKFEKEITEDSYKEAVSFLLS